MSKRADIDLIRDIRESSDQDIEVLLVLQPVAQKVTHMPELSEWPEDFFKTTAGAFKDRPLKREAQGEYEIRESIK